MRGGARAVWPAVLVGWGGLAAGGEVPAPGLPAGVRAEVRPAERLPAGRYAAEGAWEAEGEHIKHRGLTSW